MVGAALLVALGQIAVGTTSGVEQDILGFRLIPSWLLDVVAVIVVLSLLVLPVTIAVDQIMRRRSAWILDELLAAALGFLLAYGLSLVLSAYASRDLLDALTRVKPPTSNCRFAVPRGAGGVRVCPVSPVADACNC